MDDLIDSGASDVGDTITPVDSGVSDPGIVDDGASDAGASVAENAGESGHGFSSFNKLKNHLGSPDEGNEWHHIVEQSQIKKSSFPSSIINSTDNVAAINKDVHRIISGYYNSIDRFTEGMRVRNWLAGQSFDAQFNFGSEVLKKYGIGL